MNSRKAARQETILPAQSLSPNGDKWVKDMGQHVAHVSCTTDNTYQAESCQITPMLSIQLNWI